jgi:cobalt-zinc-cadmium efflux system outer membrane protein
MPGPAANQVVEPTGVVSLQQALDLALKHSPELKAISWDVSAAEAARFQADLRPNPELEVEVEEVGGAGNRSGFDGAETTIAIAQPIEMGHKRARRTTLASLGKELAEWDHKAKRLDVTKEVTESFAAVLAWQERLALADEVVRIAEKAHNAVSQRVEAGRDSPIEQTKSSVALATARIEPQRARRALESARTRLAAAWGAKVARFDSVVGDLGQIAPVPSSAELSRLVGHNPDVARWETEMKKSRAGLELEKARAVSDVTLSGGLQYFNETNDSAAVFGLSIPLAISDRNQGGIRRATYLLAKTEQSGRAAEIKVLAALDEAAQRLAAAYAEATTLKNDVLPGAQSSFDAVSEGYRDGKFDYLQVLDAQRTLFETRGRYVESLAAYHKAKADAERLIGQSIDTITKTHEDNK